MARSDNLVRGAAKKTARRPLCSAIALEPRMMFDAAAVSTAAEVADTHEVPPQAPEPASDNSQLLDSLAQAEPPAAAAPQNDATPRHDVIFVDALVKDYQRIVDAAGPDAEVVILDGGKDGLQQMAAYLAGRSDIDAIHVVGHGNGEHLFLGRTVLRQDNIDLYKGELARIGAALTADGDMLFYGCETGGEAGGQALLAKIAEFTQADIAASDDATGGAARGGDWALEYTIGQVGTSVSNGFDMTALASYDGYLAGQVFAVTHTADDGSVGSFRWALAMAEDASNPGYDYIVFNPGMNGQTITLTSNLQTVTEALTITGLYNAGGMGTVTIDGGQNRGFVIDPGSAGKTNPVNFYVSGVNFCNFRAGSATAIGFGAVIRTMFTGTYNAPIDVTVTRGEIYNNTATSGGAIHFANLGGVTSTLTLDRVIFHHNTAEALSSGAAKSGYGAGGAVLTQGNAEITNSLFHSNTAKVGTGPGNNGGGAIYVSDASATRIVNSTIVNNLVERRLPESTAMLEGGGVFSLGSDADVSAGVPVYVENTIITGNNVNYGSGNVSSNLFGQTSPYGSNNLVGVAVDFVNAAANDYRLAPTATNAIDRGNNTPMDGGFMVGLPSTDLAGSSRQIGAKVDIGAYERAANVAPSATNMSPVPITIAEDNGPYSLPVIVVTDNDVGDMITARVTLSDKNAGTLASNGSSLYYNANTDPVRGIWEFTGTVAQVNAALASLTFIPAANYAGTVTLATHIHDQNGEGPADGAMTITVAPVNDAPTATNLTQTHTIAEDSGALNLSDIVVTDVDGGDTITARVTLNDPAAGGLSASAGSYNAGTGVWQFTGTAAQVNAALASLSFTPAANYSGTVTLATHVHDQNNTGPADGAVTIGVTPVNDAPTATNLMQTKSYTEGAASVALDPIVVTEIDGDGISVTVTLMNPATGTLFSAVAPGAYNAATGVWNYLGSVADVNAALAALIFQPGADNDVTTYLVVRIRDFTNMGPSDGAIVLNVTPANDAPTATNLTQSHTIAEDSAALNLSDIVVADMDGADTITARVTLNDPAAGALSASAGSYTSGTGVWQFTGTAAQVNAALASLSFTPAANYSGTVTLATHVHDQSNAGPADGAITITVTPVNDAPTATNLTQSHTIAEDSAALNLSDIVVTEVDGGDTITARVTLNDPAAGALSASAGIYTSGTGVWQFTGTAAQVNAALASLSFTPAANYSGAVTLATHVHDQSNAGPADGAITITVTPVNDAPTATNLTQSHTIAEDSGALNLSDIAVTDVDGGDTITARVTLNDPAAGVLSASAGSYNAGTGVWQFTGTAAQVNAALASLGFTPAANYSGTVTLATHVHDQNNAGPADGAVTITVTAVNDAPTATNLTQSHTIAEDSGALNLSDIAVTDVDGGDTITARVTLNDPAAGALSASAGSYNAGTGVWQFTGTVAQVNAALASLSFTPAANYSGTVTLATHVHDQNNTGPADGAVTITVTPVNDAPTATNLTQTHTIAEDSGALNLSDIVVADMDGADTITARVTLNDPAAGALSASAGSYNAGTGVWQFTGTAAQVNAALASLSFTPAANYSGTVTLATHVHDQNNAGPADGAVTITVTPVDDAPVITGAAPVLTPIAPGQTAYPFSGVAFSDADPAGLVTVRVIPDSMAKGGFTPASLALSRFVDQGGVFEFVGTVADATTAIRQLEFQSSPSSATPGTLVTTSFVIAIGDGTSTATSGASQVVCVVPDYVSAIGGTQGGQIVGDNATIMPFSGVTLTDGNATQLLTVTVTLADASKGDFTALAGFTGGNGVYSFTGTAAQAEAALKALVFSPAANRVEPGLTETTAFSIAVANADGTGSPVVDNVTSVTLSSVNDAPTALADQVSVVSDTPTVIDVLANDSDPDKATTLTVTSVTSPAHGTVTVGVDGTLTYTPDRGYHGADSFTYQVEDGMGGVSTGVVTIVVNAPPAAVNDRFTPFAQLPESTRSPASSTTGSFLSLFSSEQALGSQGGGLITGAEFSGRNGLLIGGDFVGRSELLIGGGNAPGLAAGSSDAGWGFGPGGDGDGFRFSGERNAFSFGGDKAERGRGGHHTPPTGAFDRPTQDEAQPQRGDDGVSGTEAAPQGAAQQAPEDAADRGAGKPGLTAQLRMAGRHGMHGERIALLSKLGGVARQVA